MTITKTRRGRRPAAARPPGTRRARAGARRPATVTVPRRRTDCNLAPTMAGRIADTVLYSGVAAPVSWWLLTRPAYLANGPAIVLAALIGLATAARVWLYGPPAWWLRATSADNWRLVRRHHGGASEDHS